jgi:hypothetical protein
MLARESTTQVADELWPLVRNEKRGNGAPVFTSRGCLISHLSYAFHRKRIDGAQSGHNSSIWLSKDATLNYITKYVELAKEGGAVKWGRGIRPALRPARKSHQKAAPAPDKVVTSPELEFIAVAGSGSSRHVKAASVEEAASKILTEMGMRFYRVDGNRLTLAGKLDPWDK